MSQPKSLLHHLLDGYDRYRNERRPTSPNESSFTRPSRLRRTIQWFTPNGGTLLIVALLILTQRAWAYPLAANVPGPSATTINYQGRLSNPSGTPLNATLGMSFAIYTAATGGTLVWGPENHTAITVKDGLFSVGLGSQTSGGIPTTAWNGDRYLQITVGGETLSPRELIRSVPIAGMALTVPDGAITSEKLSRTVHRVGATSDTALPVPNTNYDILSLTITLERETLVTIHASAGGQNNATDTLFSGKVYVDEELIIFGDDWIKTGIGEQMMLSTSIMLGPGQHQVKLRASSWSASSHVNGDERTQLVVIEG